MLRSLYTGISGLRSHQTMMDVTGNNIANVNTTGYKSANTIFEDTLSQTLKTAGRPQGAQGGTNPAQVGLGVRVAGITTNFSQGATQVTGRNTDMLIDGDGFFVTKVQGENYYTRNGSFTLDAQGSLVSSGGGRVQGWQAVNGAVDTTNVPGALSIPVGQLIPPAATAKLTMGGTLNALTPLGTPVPLNYRVYDTGGSPNDLSVTFTPVAPLTGDVATNWDANYSYRGSAPTKFGTVVFSPTGDLVSTSDPATTPPSFNLTVPPLTGGNGQPFTAVLDASKLTGTSAGTPEASSTAKITDGDGFPAAALSSWEVSPDGSITGAFTNGQTRTLGRLAVANFNNPEGLSKAGGSLYSGTVNSGNAAIGPANSDGRGKIVTGSLEMSNVDLAQEFTNLIVSQRGFQANSRIITTSDEMLQELVNLKR